MTATLDETSVPLLRLAYSDRPQRPATLPPLEEPGFRALVREAHPELEQASQRHRSLGETVHVVRDRLTHEFAVLYQRDTGDHVVAESGYPWLDRLNQLAGMWEATRTSRRGDRA